MRLGFLAITSGVLILLSSAAEAQPPPSEPRLRLAASLGGANLFRIEDRSYGRTLNLGAGAGLRITRTLWLHFEANRFVGLEADPAPCGLVDIACIGGGREGYSRATVASAGLAYHFGSDQAHVAVTGGIDYVRATGFATTTFAGTGQQTEREVTDDGWGPMAGLAVRVPLRSRWGIEPAFRVYGAGAPNLTAIRLSIAITRDF
jgi:hypothetical protein